MIMRLFRFHWLTWGVDEQSRKIQGPGCVPDVLYKHAQRSELVGGPHGAGEYMGFHLLCQSGWKDQEVRALARRCREKSQPICAGFADQSCNLNPYLPPSRKSQDSLDERRFIWGVMGVEGLLTTSRPVWVECAYPLLPREGYWKLTQGLPLVSAHNMLNTPPNTNFPGLLVDHLYYYLGDYKWIFSTVYFQLIHLPVPPKNMQGSTIAYLNLSPLCFFALFSMSLHLSECHITLVLNGQHLFIITYIFTVLVSFTLPCTPLFLYGITFLHLKKLFKYFF